MYAKTLAFLERVESGRVSIKQEVSVKNRPRLKQISNNDVNFCYKCEKNMSNWWFTGQKITNLIIFFFFVIEPW